MNFLDVRTVIFSHLVTDTLCVLVIVSLWYQNRKRFAGTSWWLLDFAFQATATLLIILRGSIPDLMSMVVANTLVIAGALAGYIGLERFIGKTSSQVHNYILLAAFAGIHTYFVFVQPNLAVRNLNLSLGLLIVSFQCARLILRRVRPDLRRMMLKVGLVFGVFCLISLVRIVVILACPQPGDDFFQSGAFDTLILLSYQMLLILLAYSLTLMVNGRLLVEIQAQEETLREGEERYRQAQKLGHIGNWEFNLRTNTFWGSEEAKRLYGFDPQLDDFSVDEVEDCIPERERVHQTLIDLIQAGQPYNLEFEIKPRNTTRSRIIASLAELQKDEYDRPQKVIGVIQDITARQQANLRLASAQERLKEAHRLAHIGTWDWMIENDTVTWSEELCHIAGRDPSLPAPSYAEHPRVYTPASWELLSGAVTRVLTTGEPYNLELELVRPDGSLRWINAFGGVKRDGQGKVIGLHGTVQDIAERKQAEDALRETNAYLENLINYANAPIIVWNPRFRITRFNHAFEFLTGRTEAEVIGQSLEILFPPALVENSMALIRQTSTGERWETVEIEILHRDESVRTVLWNSATLFAPDGQTPIATIAQGQDITDRKRAEEALQRAHDELSAANAELARAARLKDEFLANMSHELRTPLNAILGLSEILREAAYGPINDKQAGALRNIEESGQHLLTLINDVLDLAKIGAGKVELNIEPVRVDDVCQAALQLIKEIAHQKRLFVSSQIDSRVTVVNADSRRLKQILVNLLSNAVKFTPEGGQLGLEVQGDPPQETVRFTVWDTGIGIAAEHLPQLFKSFVQIDSRLSRQYEGTGLGLTLVARLVEMHGGSVSVESQVGRGSRFTVSLPWRELDASQGDWKLEVGEAGNADSSRRSVLPLILVVEDNEMTLQSLVDYLTVAEFRVTVARNGVEAIQRAQEDSPAAIIMDIQMPVMDGLEAIGHIRAIPALARVPIIALTALAMSGDRERCLAAGANDYLSKPARLKQLVTTLEAQLAQAAVFVPSP